MPSPAPERHGLGFRRLALLCAALLSCTTIRTSVSTIEPAVAMREGRPEPQLELWVESNKPLTPEEAERYRSEARAALEKALAGRAQPDGEGELVVIRAQGVTRTSGHRSDQVAATTGIVVGAVVIVAAVVVAIVMGGKNNSSGGGHAKLPSASAPRVGGGASVARGGAAVARGGASVARGGASIAGAAVARLPRVPVASAPRLPMARGFPTVPAPSRLPSAPAPGTPSFFAPGAPYPHRSPGPSVNVEVGFWWMIPISESPEPAVYDLPPGPPPPDAYPEDEAGEPAQENAAEPAPLSLPPPGVYPVEDRSFFDGDRLVLEAVVVDRASGEALWVKRVSRKADPRDARAVKEAVDQLLTEGGWQAPAPE